MKALRIALLAIITFAGIKVTNAQTVDEIITKHIEAIGGKEKLSQINSLYMENSVDVMGNQAPSYITILNGKGFKSVIDFNGQKIIQVLTDKGGWAVNPMMGATTPTEIPAEQLKGAKDQLYISGPLFNYAQKGSKAELLGKDDAQGGAYKIKLTSKDSSVSTFYIDPVKYYIQKVIKTQFAGGQEQEITLTFSDYKKTDFGFVVPYTTEMQLSQFTLKYTLKKIDINQPVDESIFKAG